jgi:hypothetical protein
MDLKAARRKRKIQIAELEEWRDKADKTWIPDLPKGSDNYQFGWIRDTPIRLQIQRNEPCNLSTMNPLVIHLAAA